MADTVQRLLALHSAMDKPFVIDPSSAVSYGDTDSSTTALAAALVRAGVGKGDRVGLLMPNGVEWARIAVAVMRMGAVLVPLSTLLTGPELAAQLKVASVRYLIAVEEFRGHRYHEELEPHVAELPALQRIWTDDDILALRPDRVGVELVTAMADAVSAADTMVVMFTSGSSGTPKGVVHSHGNAIGAVRASLGPRCVRADSRLYLPMPLFWMGGFGGGLMTALVAGATLVTEPAPRPDSTVQLLQRERVTLFRGWPDQAAAVAREAERVGADLTSLQPGSLDAVLPPDLRAAPGARANLFGMTESFGPYCGYRADTDLPVSAWGSCGRPFDGVEVRIVDVDSGLPLPSGSTGEIQVRGPHMMRGICRRSREDVFTVDGYYATGDLGHLDTDGFLFYRGRADDMFKVNGASVYPSEVVAALQSLDGVQRAFVTDVAGDRVAAFVVCDDGTSVDGLRTSARAVLSSFKVPTVWLVADSDADVPRGSSGKVDVRRLRVLLSEQGWETGR